MATNRIKGLTVEIGGDTTELGKALEAVDKKTRSLSGELRDINRLLKFDPDNVELLAQKQATLTEAVEETAEKLEILREAEKQVQKQFEKGEVSADQVRELQREIIQAEKRMKSYEAAIEDTTKALEKAEAGTDDFTAELKKAGRAIQDFEKETKEANGELREIDKLLKLDPSSVTMLTQKQEVLADSIQKTTRRLDDLKRAEQEVQARFAKGEASADQVRELQRAVEKAEQSLRGWSDELDRTNRALDGLDDAAEDLEESLEDVSEELDDAEDEAEETADAMDGLAEKMGDAATLGVKVLAASVVAVTAALTGAAESSRDYRREMGKLETAFTAAGHSSEAATTTYRTLQGILGETEQAVEAANHLAMLTDNEQDLATWTNIATGVYATFGESLPIEGLAEAANETAKVGQVTGPLADALNWAGISEDALNASLAACTTEQQRQRQIMTILNGVYDEAAEKYRVTNAEIIRAYEANEAWAEAVAGVGEVVEPLLSDIKLMGASLASEFVPAIGRVIASLQALMDETQQPTEGGVLAGILGTNYDAAGEVGASIGALVGQIVERLMAALPTITAVGMSLISTLATSLINSLPQLITVLTEIITTIVSGPNGLTALLPQITAAVVGIAPKIAAALAEAIPLLSQAAVDLLMTLVSAVPQILPPLVGALPQLVTAIAEALPVLVPGLIEAAIALIDELIVILPELFPPIIEALLTGAEAILMAILDNLPALFTLLLDTLTASFWEVTNALTLAVMDAVPQLVGIIVNLMLQLPHQLLEIFKSIVNGFKNMFANLKNSSETLTEQLRASMASLWSRIVTTVQGVVSKLPGHIRKYWQDMATAITTIGQRMLTAAGQKFDEIRNTITEKLQSLAGKLPSIGGDLVMGLWNGLNNKLGWLKSKISGFASSVLDSIKSFFGIASPSKETAWMGEMLDEGLAEGMLDSMAAPVRAIRTVTRGVLDSAETEVDGLSIERRLNASAASAPQVVIDLSGVLERLDSVVSAIERGQVLTIDGQQLVGATAARLDSKLGQIRALAARGAV